MGWYLEVVNATSMELLAVSTSILERSPRCGALRQRTRRTGSFYMFLWSWQASDFHWRSRRREQKRSFGRSPSTFSSWPPTMRPSTTGARRSWRAPSRPSRLHRRRSEQFWTPLTPKTSHHTAPVANVHHHRDLSQSWSRDAIHHHPRPSRMYPFSGSPARAAHQCLFCAACPQCTSPASRTRPHFALTRANATASGGRRHSVPMV